MPTRQDRPPSPGPRPPAGSGVTEPPPAEAAQLDALRWVRIFGTVLIAGMVVGMAGPPWPWPLLSGVLCLAAVGVGVAGLVKVRAARLRRGTTPVLVLGMVLAAVLGLSSLGQVALWRENATYSECVRGALTQQARDACAAGFERSIDDRVRWMERLVQPS